MLLAGPQPGEKLREGRGKIVKDEEKDVEGNMKRLVKRR